MDASAVVYCLSAMVISGVFGMAYGLRLKRQIAEMVIEREEKTIPIRVRARLIAGIRGCPAEWVERELEEKGGRDDG